MRWRGRCQAIRADDDLTRSGGILPVTSVCVLGSRNSLLFLSHRIPNLIRLQGQGELPYLCRAVRFAPPVRVRIREGTGDKHMRLPRRFRIQFLAPGGVQGGTVHDRSCVCNQVDCADSLGPIGTGAKNTPGVRRPDTTLPVHRQGDRLLFGVIRQNFRVEVQPVVFEFSRSVCSIRKRSSASSAGSRNSCDPAGICC
mgnify:CR=1 FL=1